MVEVKAAAVSQQFRHEIKSTVQEKYQESPPKLVAFLSNEDPAAHKYAEWTARTCKETGILFELRRVPRTELEEAIVSANQDRTVNGIMVYYPVFGDPQDQYIQSVIDKSKDVEGLCHTYKFNMYHNIRYIDDKKKCIIPCTPLAIVKIIEYLQVYNPVGSQVILKLTLTR
jgi:methylenetetrahydrofolate dehydrogenase (NAD+)